MLEKDNDREDRIDMEVVVDAYGSDERAMGWDYYVSDNCNFPFKAKCINERRSSPLQLKDEVEVLDTSPAEQCEKEMFVGKSEKGRLCCLCALCRYPCREFFEDL